MPEGTLRMLLLSLFRTIIGMRLCRQMGRRTRLRIGSRRGVTELSSISMSWWCKTVRGRMVFIQIGSFKNSVGCIV